MDLQDPMVQVVRLAQRDQLDLAGQPDLVV